MAAWSGWKISRNRTDQIDTPLVTPGDGALDLSAEQLWAEQPYLRTVVSFLARNVAQLGLHTYRREADDSRVRARGSDSPLAALIERPNPDQTTFELVYRLVADLALFDVAYLWLIDTRAAGGGLELRPVPNRWVTGTYDSTAWRVGGYELTPDGESGKAIRVPAENMLVIHGWSPGDLREGSSPINALKSVLREQINAASYREQLWRNGGRVGTYVYRPADAPRWDNGGRSRFKKGWQAQNTGNGSKVGGSPLLEDGMEIRRVGFSAKEEDYVEGAKLALATVAAVYHVNPTMLGQLDNANYSNVREFRRMLYGDTLGPILAQVEAKMNTFLVARLDDSSAYVEFNLREKLEGSFDEQSKTLAGALTAGYMTVNEVRARLNLPTVEGGDVLRAPLNMAPVQPDPSIEPDAINAA